MIGSVKPIDWDWIAAAHTGDCDCDTLSSDARFPKFQKSLKFRLWSGHL